MTIAYITVVMTVVVLVIVLAGIITPPTPRHAQYFFMKHSLNSEHLVSTTINFAEMSADIVLDVSYLACFYFHIALVVISFIVYKYEYIYKLNSSLVPL